MSKFKAKDGDRIRMLQQKSKNWGYAPKVGEECIALVLDDKYIRAVPNNKKDYDGKLYCLLNEDEYELVKSSVYDIGSRVRISPSSEYYVCNSTVNPRDVLGTIIHNNNNNNNNNNNENFVYGVKWDNGEKNYYGKKDLIPDSELPFSVKEEFNVGEWVEIIKELPNGIGNNSDAKIGNKFKIIHVSPSTSGNYPGQYWLAGADSRNTSKDGYSVISSLVKKIPAPSLEKVRPIPKFKIGDYVRVNGTEIVYCVIVVTIRDDGKSYLYKGYVGQSDTTYLYEENCLSLHTRWAGEGSIRQEPVTTREINLPEDLQLPRTQKPFSDIYLNQELKDCRDAVNGNTPIDVSISSVPILKTELVQKQSIIYF